MIYCAVFAHAWVLVAARRACALFGALNTQTAGSPDRRLQSRSMMSPCQQYTARRAICKRVGTLAAGSGCEPRIAAHYCARALEGRAAISVAGPRTADSGARPHKADDSQTIFSPVVLRSRAGFCVPPLTHRQRHPQVTKKLLLACSLSFAFMIVEVVGGYFAGRCAALLPSPDTCLLDFHPLSEPAARVQRSHHGGRGAHVLGRPVLPHLRLLHASHRKAHRPQVHLWLPPGRDYRRGGIRAHRLRPHR